MEVCPLSPKHFSSSLNEDLIESVEFRIVDEHQQKIIYPKHVKSSCYCDCICALWWDWPNVSAVIIFGQNVRYLFRCVDVFDMTSSIQFLSVQQSIQVHTVGSGDMSHGRAPIFYGNSDHSIVENKHRRSLTGDVSLKSTILWPIIRHERFHLSNLVLRMASVPAGDSRKSSTTAHKLSAGILSNLRAVSTEMTSAAVLFCENTCSLFTCPAYQSECDTCIWSPWDPPAKVLVYNAEGCCKHYIIVCGQWRNEKKGNQPGQSIVTTLW